jgi:hypothetical protein
MRERSGLIWLMYSSQPAFVFMVMDFRFHRNFVTSFMSVSFLAKVCSMDVRFFVCPCNFACTFVR